MASGILGWLGFGKREKPSLNAPVARPKSEDLYFNTQLRDLAKKRIGGQDLGFGEDYLSKTTNPAIAQSNYRFRNETVPFLSGELSKRGIARSAGPGLATDVLGKAERQKGLDVDELVSKFYNLNELQKKQDFGQSLQLGQNLDTQQAGLLSDAAAEGERVRDLTVGQSNTRNARSDEMQGRTMQAIGALMNAVVPGSGMAFSSMRGSSGTPSMANFLQQKPTAKANVLSSDISKLSIEDLDAYNLEDMAKLFGG